MTSTTSAMASFDSIMAPSTDCSAGMSCGGVRSNSGAPPDAALRGSSTNVMRRRTPPPNRTYVRDATRNQTGLTQRARDVARRTLGAPPSRHQLAWWTDPWTTRGQPVGIAVRAVDTAVDNHVDFGPAAARGPTFRALRDPGGCGPKKVFGVDCEERTVRSGHRRANRGNGPTRGAIRSRDQPARRHVGAGSGA